MSQNLNDSTNQKEHLYKILTYAFESFKKSKKNMNNQKLKDICTSLKDPTQNFVTYSQIMKYIYALVEPFEKCSTKSMEVVLYSVEEIIKKKLVDPYIMQKMVEKLIKYITEYLQQNETIDFKVDYKILKMCELIYADNSLFIHNENLKNIVKIYLRIYLSTSQIEQFQVQTRKTLSSLISKMIEKITACNITNKSSENLLNQINIDENTDIESKKKLFYQIQLNEFNYISSKYMDFLIDLIEIQNSSNNNEIISKYIDIIQNANDNPNYTEIKKLLEKLNLNSLDIILYNDVKQYKIGKYGWCILCRKTADFWSDKLNFPICGANSVCETEFFNCLSNVYPRGDFLNMLVYLSITSTVGTEDEYSSPNTEINFLCRQFCLENIKEMIDESYTFFKDDSDVIFIIKEIFKDSLLKNTLSSNIKIFQPSLELFISIINVYREHLKEQIEIFFMKVLITFLESENLEFAFKDEVLNALLQLENDCTFLVEIYVNYDCDVNCTAVFSELINLLTKIMNRLYRKSKYKNNIKDIHETILINKTLDFLNKFIFNLNILVEKNEMQLISQNSNNNNEDSSKNNNTLTAANTELQEDTSSNSLNANFDVKDKINKNLKLKKLLEKAIEVFNIGKSTSDCLKFLQKEKMLFNENAFNIIKNEYLKNINSNTIQPTNYYSNLLPTSEQTIITANPSEDLSILDINNNKINIMQTPFISTINPLIYFITNLEKEKLENIVYEDYISFEMARFIKTNLKDLIRERVGDYLCSGKPFNIKVLTHFINNFNFENLNILDAMRNLFNELPLSGEAQVIDRVVQVFGERFHMQNPNDLKNPDHCYYLAFSLLQLNTDLHREEIEKKMSLKEFIEALNLSTGNEKIDPKYLEMLYNKIQKEPLVIPGQKLSGMKNSKKDLIKKERENIRKLTYNKLYNVFAKTNNYITDIDNDNIKHLIEFSWSNFLSIYSQLLSESDNKENKDNKDYEKKNHSYIENILLMARTCGILKLNTAGEAYINTILNMTNLNNDKEIASKNLDCIKSLVNFIVNNGQYIRTGWLNILNLISKLDYFLMTENKVIIADFKNNKKDKVHEKEINNILMKKEIICKNIPDMACEGVFTKTDKFDEETIINFVNSLCIISKHELTDYYTPRVFSLHKLVEVADFNLYRIQVEWVKIWKLISEHLINVISNSAHENIWREAIESMRQTICKLLQKKDSTIYNFQMDFFTPFELIFSQTVGTPTRGEMVINYIHYIVGSFGGYIRSGWVVIFRIIKEGFWRKDPKINEDIKNILLKIHENNNIPINVNSEIFKEYVECLCYMYLDKDLKENAFNIILSLINQLIKNSENDSKSISNSAQIQKYKKYEFLKVFFYEFDDLININIIEHLNILYSTLYQIQNFLFVNDFHSFVYLYYIYIKPHILCFLLNKYYNRFLLFEKTNDEKDDNILPYEKLEEGDTYEIMIKNIKFYLTESLSKLLINIKNEEEYLNNQDSIELLKEINDIYFNKDESATFLNKKLEQIKDIENNTYEAAIDKFIEQLELFFTNLSQNKNIKTNFNFFYEDLVQTIHELLIINKYSDYLIKILIKIISSKKIKSKKVITNINKCNMFILKNISNIKNNIPEEEYIKFIKFGFAYSNFLLCFIQNYESDLINEYKYISKILNNILERDLVNKLDKSKILNSTLLINYITKLQDIKDFILKKIEIKNNADIFDESALNILINFNKIYNKYKLEKEENNVIFEVLKFELENIKNFMEYLKGNYLKIIYISVLDFTCSINYGFRDCAKNILYNFTKNNLISFKHHIQ